MYIKQEKEKELIRKSITIDKDSGKADAKLTFIEDPVSMGHTGKDVPWPKHYPKWQTYPQQLELGLGGAGTVVNCV